MSTVQKRLKELRKEAKLTQADVSKILNISESAYGYYEQGRNEISISSLQKLADLYKVSSDYLLGLTDQKEPSDSYEIQTIAAHHDGEDWTEEELDEIARFKEFVRMKRGNKPQE